MIINVNENNFEKEVIIADQKVLVDFWASWCMPCKMMHPVLEKLDEEMGNKVKITKININESPALAEKYGVMSIPTFLLFENGEIKKSMVGATSYEGLKEFTLE